MPTRPVNGVDLAYDESGAGPAVLLLHAGIADRRMWNDVLPEFTAHFRVVRPDLRGYGETPLPDGAFVYASDLVALLESLEISRAHVVGVSMGGHVGLDLAIARPELVDRLVLVGSGVDGWQHDEALLGAWKEEEAAFERGDLDGAAWISVRTWLDGPSRAEAAVDASLRRRVFEMQRRAYELENTEASSGWLTPSRRDRLAAVAAPTLVLVGDLDQPSLQHVATLLADEIPGARHHTLHGVAHLPPLENPAEFTSAVLPFLREADA